MQIKKNNAALIPNAFDLFNNDTTTALYFQCILIAPNSDIYRFAIPVPVDYDHVRLPCFLWQRQHTVNTPLSMYLSSHTLPAAHPARRPHLHHLSKLLLSATLHSGRRTLRAARSLVQSRIIAIFYMYFTNAGFYILHKGDILRVSKGKIKE